MTTETSDPILDVLEEASEGIRYKDPLAGQFFTPDSLAELLAVDRRTVMRLIHDGKLAHIRVGRMYRIPRYVVLQFIDGGGVEEV